MTCPQKAQQSKGHPFFLPTFSTKRPLLSGDRVRGGPLMRRLKLEQADWHVTLRGARRLLLFHDDADYKTFYAMLGVACRDSGMGLLADCLMSNHFHLSLSGGSKQLTQCMRKLDRAYSGYHNERYNLSGHAFEQAYYCEPIPSEFILQRVVRYIHLNPVRGGKVSRPEDYPWSGYRRMISSKPAVLTSEETRVLRTFDRDLGRAQEIYQSFTEKALKRRVIRPVGRTSAWEIWQEQFTWILEHSISQAERLHPLDAQKVAIYLSVKAGIPPRAIGKVLGHPDGKQVSQVCYRLSKALSEDAVLKARVEALHVL
jgi:putative transposase